MTPPESTHGSIWPPHLVTRPAELILPAGDAPIDSALLFPTDEVRNGIESWLGNQLALARKAVMQGPVSCSFPSEKGLANLSEFDFAAPRNLTELLRWTILQMEDGHVHVTHPRYFGLFNPAPTFAAECADRIVASFNPQLASATTSPFPVAVEAHVIRAVAKRISLGEEAFGHFTSGGSEANYTAVICALTRAHEDFAATGARCFSGSPTIYTSADSHLAWLKICHQAGIGRQALRLVPTDGTGRMSMTALNGKIEADQQIGHVPLLVVATAGTTSAGMIDPIVASAEIAKQHGLWFHVDAAWGGAAVASDRLSPHLAGIERADSVTIDAHKWFAVTMGCGMFLTRHPEALHAAFHASMPCMPSNAAFVDPYMMTMQWSRRFLGLRLFLSLASAGWPGYAQHIERSVDLGEKLAVLLQGRGWQRANESKLGVVCLLPPAGRPDVQAIARAVVKSGIAWVSALPFEGTNVLRICVTNGQTSEADITLLAEYLDAIT